MTALDVIFRALRAAVPPALSSTSLQDSRRPMEPAPRRPAGGGARCWVRLNVGGRIFSTTRATLCRVPDSMLAAMFRCARTLRPTCHLRGLHFR